MATEHPIGRPDQARLAPGFTEEVFAIWERGEPDEAIAIPTGTLDEAARLLPQRYDRFSLRITGRGQIEVPDDRLPNGTRIMDIDDATYFDEVTYFVDATEFTAADLRDAIRDRGELDPNDPAYQVLFEKFVGSETLEKVGVKFNAHGRLADDQGVILTRTGKVHVIVPGEPYDIIVTQPVTEGEIALDTQTS